MTLARALRIQSTVVVLDGLVRNNEDSGMFTETHLVLFAETGRTIRNMFSRTTTSSLDATTATQREERDV